MTIPESFKAACAAHLNLPSIAEPFLDRVLAAIERLEREGEESARLNAERARLNAESAEMNRRMEALLGQMQASLQEIRRRG